MFYVRVEQNSLEKKEHIVFIERLKEGIDAIHVNMWELIDGWIEHGDRIVSVSASKLQAYLLDSSGWCRDLINQCLNIVLKGPKKAFSHHRCVKVV